jgi:hypothetical protein
MSERPRQTWTSNYFGSSNQALSLWSAMSHRTRPPELCVNVEREDHERPGQVAYNSHPRTAQFPFEVVHLQLNGYNFPSVSSFHLHRCLTVVFRPVSKRQCGQWLCAVAGDLPGVQLSKTQIKCGQDDPWILAHAWALGSQIATRYHHW